MAGRGPRTCSKCSAPILVWRNTSGNYTRVDASPDEHGTVRRLVTRDPVTGRDVPMAQVLKGPQLAEAIANSELLFTRHQSTCSANRPHNPKPAGLQVLPTNH